MSVWVLVAVISVHQIMGGHVEEYIHVYATSAACERDRAKMQDLDTDKDAVWRCIRQEPT